MKLTTSPSFNRSIKVGSKISQSPPTLAPAAAKQTSDWSCVPASLAASMIPGEPIAFGIASRS